MNADDFKDSPAGRMHPTIEGQHAFVPAPLPDAVALSPDLVYRLDEASRAVATLSGVGETLENPYLLIAPFARREAVLSSRIEGTQASLSDLYRFEAGGGADIRDVLEVANYVAATDLASELLNEIPICGRLVNAVHERLMQGVRGGEMLPGAFRTSQVWIASAGSPIGDARFVPPPHERLPDLMAEWERFVNADLQMPPLIQCALLHYQFETIHPYLDGNGRIGRLLIGLFLIQRGVLRTPLLYLSAYLERHRQEYYDHLLRISMTGEWAPWLGFFLDGVAEQAKDAVSRARALRDLHEDYRHRLTAAGESANALRLMEFLFVSPILTRRGAADFLHISTAGARGIIERMEAIGILASLPDTRPRLFVARDLIDAVDA